MLRRACISFLLLQQRRGQQHAAVAGVASATTARWCATTTQSNRSSNTRRDNQRSGYNDTANPNSNNGYNNNNNNNNRRRRDPRRVLPPAFDIVHWNNEDASAGHMLRVIHQDSYIVLDYHKQASKAKADVAAASEENEGAEEDALKPKSTTRSGRPGQAERVVTVTLPPVYIARFLGVLEGRSEKVTVQSRFTDATFTTKAGTDAKEKAFVLSCHSRRPTSGQRQTADGEDTAGDSVDWTVEMDAAESLMLHRFLTQALQYNTGFSRRV